MRDYIILLWQVVVIISMLGSVYYSHKGDEHKEIVCMLHTIIGCVMPLAFYLLG